MRPIVALLLLAPAAAAVPPAAAGSVPQQRVEITELPGWSPRALPSRQYSGHLEVEPSMYMHYWFIESESAQSADDPILVWFNGGPGSSSLFGMLAENGPFVVGDASLQGPAYEATGVPQLFYNPQGWQTFSNYLAISMPPPVGFSYCDPAGPGGDGYSCGNWNDTRTADVTHTFLEKWFTEAFPEFAGKDTYLTGESYAGVYVPRLTQTLLADKSSVVNLKGIAVGDACMPPALCASYTPTTGPYYDLEKMHGMHAFSTKLYDTIQTECSGIDLKELVPADAPAACTDAIAQVPDEIGGYYEYAYYDDCYYQHDRRRLSSALPNHSSRDGGMMTPNGYQCGAENAELLYLNQTAVRLAIGVDPDSFFFQADGGAGMNYTLDGTDLVSWMGSVATDPEIDLRVLVYEGDADASINSFAAEAWVTGLNLTEVEAWRPWTTDGCRAMGGAVVRYEGDFDFLMVRGSGHMVPEFKPLAAHEFMKQWITGKDYKLYDSECTAPDGDGDDDNDNTATEKAAQAKVLSRVAELRAEADALEAGL
jgi:serine carboxypeptidase-like clade 1